MGASIDLEDAPGSENPEITHDPDELEALKEDAAKWRALRNCTRIISKDGDALKSPVPGHAEVTLTFSTHGFQEVAEYHREMLERFVAIARAIPLEVPSTSCIPFT